MKLADAPFSIDVNEAGESVMTFEMSDVDWHTNLDADDRDALDTLRGLGFKIVRSHSGVKAEAAW